MHSLRKEAGKNGYREAATNIHYRHDVVWKLRREVCLEVLRP